MKKRLKPVEIGEHLIVHPGVCFGRLTFKGTRVPVETILYFLSIGRSIRKIREGWPEISRAAIAEAINLAGRALVKQSGAKPLEADEPAHSGRSA